MACGAPVITSNNSSLNEITENCALHCDPYSVDEIYSCMSKTVTDESNSKRLIKLGIENAKRFTWKKTALKTLNVFNSCHN